MRNILNISALNTRRKEEVVDVQASDVEKDLILTRPTTILFQGPPKKIV